MIDSLFQAYTSEMGTLRGQTCEIGMTRRVIDVVFGIARVKTGEHCVL